MKTKISSLFLILCLINAACNRNNTTTTGTEGGSTTNQVDTLALLEEAYLYGLPLVIMDITRQQLHDPDRGPFYAPPNQFRHNSSFPDASFRNVVRPNADTYYSSAGLDLSEGPVVLSLPNTGGRYYMMPMLDAYTNVFTSPGTRTTGNKEGKFLICGPGWQGEVPTGMNKIEAPTQTVWIIGRTQVNSKEDGEKVVIPLQKQYLLQPLNPVPNETKVQAGSSPKGDPNSLVAAMGAVDYFNYLNQLLAKNPPPVADSALTSRLSTVHIGAGLNFESNAFSESLKSQVDSLPAKVITNLQQGLSGSKDLINGWNMGRKVIGTYGTDYRSRALMALFGLGANLREDAIYPTCQVDANGNPLSGKNSYTIHFDKGKTPPANAFWSLTLYDNEGYFVPNPINRYTLGDRSKLKFNDDGSFDIYIQNNAPEKEKSQNWLPCPTGSFNLLMRVYWPKEEMLKGEWTAPAVVPNPQMN